MKALRKINDWSEIHYLDFDIHNLTLDIPTTLVRNKKLSNREKHAAILAYGLLNYLNNSSKVVTKEDIQKLSNASTSFYIPKSVWKHPTMINKSVFLKFLQRLGVAPNSRYSILNTLLDSYFTVSYNEETGDIYLRTTKAFYFPFDYARLNHGYRLVMKDPYEIKQFAKPKYVNAFFVKFIYAEPYIGKKGLHEFRPLTYKQVAEIIGSSVQSVVTAIKMFKSNKKVYKFIEVSSHEFYAHTSGYGKDGFYTRIKVYSEYYTNSLSKYLIGHKQKSLYPLNESYTSKFYRLEGMRIISNYETTSVRLNKRSRNSSKKYKHKGFKLKIYDGLTRLNTNEFIVKTPNEFRTVAESEFNSRYHNEFESTNTISVNIIANSLNEAVKKLKAYSNVQSFKKVINIANKIVKFFSINEKEFDTFSFSYYKKNIAKLSSEISFNNAKDGIASAVRKVKKIISNIFDKSLFNMSSLSRMMEVVNYQYKDYEGTTVKRA